MNLVIMLVAGINIGVILGAWWATCRIREPHVSWSAGEDGLVLPPPQRATFQKQWHIVFS